MCVVIEKGEIINLLFTDVALRKGAWVVILSVGQLLSIMIVTSRMGRVNCNIDILGRTDAEQLTPP